MPLGPFKLKKANAPARLADFDAQPSWGDLASKIAQLFNIPLKDVGVAFINKARDAVTLTNEQELQRFYKSLDQSSEEIKFVVQDLQTPDPPNTIASTWSADSNLSDLSKTDDKLKLWCWILNKPGKPFPVNIPKSETVGDLTKAIKAQKEHALVGIDAGRLDIWKLSPPIPSSELGVKLGHVPRLQDMAGCVELNPFDELSEHFSSPPRKHLHIVVQLPPILVGHPSQPVNELPDLERRHAISVQQGKDAPTPSSAARLPLFKHEQETRPIMNGRPNHGLPVHLFHPAFSHFQHTLADPNINLTADDYIRTHKYMSVSAALYGTEPLRREAILTCLNEAIHFNLISVANADRTNAGGFVVAPTADNYIARSGFHELKNEVGSGGTDPTIQGSLSYRKTWISDDLSPVRRSCCCPSFILSIAGPWMCISGAVFTETVVVRQLTDYVWTGGNPYNDKALESVARLFKALSVGLQDLKIFYGNLTAAPVPNIQRMFPFTRSYVDSLGQNVDFQYIKRLDETGAIYLAESTSRHQLIVKFVQRYNSRAHYLLASHGMAPQLHYWSLDDPNSKTMGALGVVIMDFIPGSDAYKLYSKTQLPDAIYDGVKQAIDILHTESIVFGDLRLPNVVITERQIPMLIDFDWCGTHGIDRYPSGLNDLSSIGWHEGVMRNGVMLMEHDTCMLKTMQPDHSMDWSR